MISNDPTLVFANIISRLKTESKAYYVLFLSVLNRNEIGLKLNESRLTVTNYVLD